MTIKYGIISTAQVVPRFIAGVRESQSGEVAAVASRDLAKAQAFAQQHQIPTAYGSYQELYRDPTIDIVYIATYNAGHYAAAKEALLAGKNVLLEKPFTLNAAETTALFDLARTKGLFLMEAQKAVFLPITQQIKEILANGEIGAIQRVESTTAYPNIDHVTWFHDLSAGGGTLHGSGSYPIEYLLAVLQLPMTDYHGTAIFPPGETDRQCDLTLRFGNQILANIFITTTFARPNLMQIFGTKGAIHIPDFWKTKRATVIRDGVTEELTAEQHSEFVFEVDHVNDCLEKGLTTSPVMTPEITINCVRMVESLYEEWLAKD